MVHSSIRQKVGLILLTLCLGGGFYYTFLERSKTFFTKHPVYKGLLKKQDIAFELNASSKVENDYSPIMSNSQDMVGDLVKINKKHNYLEQDEIELFKNIIHTINTGNTSLVKKANQKKDPFLAFRGTWKAADNSFFISRDNVRFDKDNKLNLQYLEFRSSNGGKAYGLNSTKNIEGVIFSEVRTPEYIPVMKRVGHFLSTSKILWVTTFGNNEETKDNWIRYRISIDEILDNILQVKNIDINLKKESKKIDKVDITKHLFEKVSQL